MTAEQAEAPTEELAPLKPREIIALKKKLREHDGRNLGMLCAWIATDILSEADKDAKAFRAKAEQEGSCYASTHPEYASREDFAVHVGAIAINGWFVNLKAVIESPGAEWGENITPPQDIAAWFKEMEQYKTHSNMVAAKNSTEVNNG